MSDFSQLFVSVIGKAHCCWLQSEFFNYPALACRTMPTLSHFWTDLLSDSWNLVWQSYGIINKTGNSFYTHFARFPRARCAFSRMRRTDWTLNGDRQTDEPSTVKVLWMKKKIWNRVDCQRSEKKIQNTQKIKRTLLNWTKQDKTCKFSRKSSFFQATYNIKKQPTSN